MSSPSAQSSADGLDYCEHNSLTKSYKPLVPDLLTKPGPITTQAVASQIHVGKYGQFIQSVIHQCNGQPMPPAILNPRRSLINSLQSFYLSIKNLSIFRIKAEQEVEFKVPLEEIYVRLGIIESKERIARDQALNKHSDYIQDDRIPTFETIPKPIMNIEIEQLFEPESFEKKEAKRIYIQGAAGIGKSTLCHYIAYRWAKKELWQNVFSVLFWIPLRNLTLRKYPADKEYTPADLIAKEYAGKIDLRVIEACINDAALREKTLLVLDGYDELSAEAQGNTSLARVFKELKEVFPHILITSRPGSCSFNRSCELELLGFDKEGVERYIDRFFKQVHAEEKKQKLYQLLQRSPHVSSLARIPINLTLLCCLFNEDPEAFNSNQPITMTAIYERIVNWMYKWFLLRRIDQGKSNQTKEKILTEKNLRHNQEVAKVATAFEEMADFAMKKNTLYLEKGEIDHFRGNAITSNELADCGLIRIPEEKGYFIHLTFQEFLTASKVANQYLPGGSRQACQDFVSNYKFEPRYNLVLRMIAGYLSLSTSRNRCYLDSNPLQLFFNDLFAEPQKLAGRSELPLIAECFEECQNPAQVRQYEGFIKRVKDYITQPYLSSLDFGRLIRNKKILNHPTIMETIRELLSAPQTREDMLDTLLNTIATGQRLPPEIVRFIAEVLKNCDNYYADKKFIANVVYVLEVVVRQGGELTMEALDALIQVLNEGKYNAQYSAADALQLVAQQGGEFAKEALDALLQGLKEGDYGTKKHAADALAKVASKGGEFAKEALDAVMRIFKEGDPDARNNAVHSLAIVAKGEGEFAKEALDTLMRILNEGDSDTSRHAANALSIGVQQGGQFAKKALVALIQALKEGDYSTKEHAADALAVLTKQGREFAKEALVALVGILNEGDPDTSKHAANALAIGVQRGGPLAKKALVALLQALKEGNYGAKKHAAAALAIVAQLGGEIANEVFDDLIQILQEGDRDAKIFAAEVLEVVARQGDEIAKDKLMNLETFRIYPFIFPAFEEQQEQSNYSITHTSVYEEIALKIFNELGLQDLCHARLVCKEWKQLIEQTDGWRRLHSKNFKGNSPKHHLQATDQTNHLQSSLIHWKQPQIAKLLWHDSSTIISDSVELKVNAVAAYLHREGFELKGVPSDGDCFFSAFLGSYGRLSRKIPLLEDHNDKISYLRQVLSDMVKHTDSKRAEDIKRKAAWISGLGEGDLLASALSIPIRLVTVNEEHLRCGVYDSLIFPEAGLSEEDRSQEWKNIPQEKRPKEYIVIVDLGGHFIYAQKP